MKGLGSTMSEGLQTPEKCVDQLEGEQKIAGDGE